MATLPSSLDFFNEQAAAREKSAAANQKLVSDTIDAVAKDLPPGGELNPPDEPLGGPPELVKRLRGEHLNVEKILDAQLDVWRTLASLAEAGQAPRTESFNDLVAKLTWQFTLDHAESRFGVKHPAELTAEQITQVQRSQQHEVFLARLIRWRNANVKSIGAFINLGLQI
jgi:hypothetical protein